MNDKGIKLWVLIDTTAVFQVELIVDTFIFKSSFEKNVCKRSAQIQLLFFSISSKEDYTLAKYKHGCSFTKRPIHLL